MSNPIEHNNSSTRANLKLIGAVCLALLSIAQVGYRFAWQPLQEKRLGQKRLEAQLAHAEADRRLERAMADRWLNSQAESFSADPAILAHHYQQWLLRRTAGMPGVQIASTPPVREGDIGWNVGFQVEGTSTASWIAGLVDELERTPLMHQITFLDLERSPQAGYDRLNFRLHLVALSLQDAESKTQWPQARPPLAGDKKLGEVLATLQPFRQGYAGPPPRVVSAPRPPQAKPQPKIDPLKSVDLIGSVEVGGIAQGWIVDHRLKTEMMVTVDDSIELEDFSAKVSVITPNYLELATADGSPLRWPLGKSLRSILTSSAHP